VREAGEKARVHGKLLIHVYTEWHEGGYNRRFPERRCTPYLSTAKSRYPIGTYCVFEHIASYRDRAANTFSEHL
jgi:hypothetical protein